VDQALGASTDAFEWDTSGSLLPVISELRDYAGDRSLPKRLGCAWGDEPASILALRTVSRTALVALAALPGIAMPLARMTTPGRLPFLAVAGVTARSWLANLAAIAAFCAASFYVTTRIITADTNNHGKAHQTQLGEIISPPVLAMGIALLVVIGVLLFFGWRAFKSSRHLTNGLWMLAVLLSSGAVAIAYGWDKLGLAQTLTGSGGLHPGKWTMALVFIGAGLGIAGVRQLTAVKNLTESARERWSWATPIISLGAAGLILVWATPHLVHALNDGSSWHNWHRIAAAASIASVPILIAYFALQWRRLLSSPPPTRPPGSQPATLGAADGASAAGASPASDERPAEIVAGFLASFSMVASLVGIAFRPVRLITFALAMALIAAAMAGSRARLPGLAVRARWAVFRRRNGRGHHH
jgi:hypothetical protein